MRPDDEALVVPCSRCSTRLYPVYAQKPDGSLIFPPHVIRFDHAGGVVCKRPRHARNKHAVRNAYLEAVS